MWEFAESVIRSKLFWSTAFFFGVYLYLKFVTFNYWKRQKVPHDAPTIVVGNILPIILGKQCVGDLLRESYERFKSHPFHGLYMYHSPHLVINDPDLIRLILVKHFAHFPDRGLYFNTEVDPLSSHLFFMAGNDWKFLRSKLSPTFTLGKIKQMFPLLEKIGQDLKKALGVSLEKSNIVDIKDLLQRFTTDVIASIAFGVECRSLKNPEAQFRDYGRKAIDLNPVKVSLLMFYSKMLDILRIPINSKEVTEFFNKVFRDVIVYRRTNNVSRKDFLNLLIQLMEHGKVEDDEKSDLRDHDNIVHNTDTISMSTACAQAFVFFIAGFETSSSTSTYCLHELAFNLEVQDKLRKEIKDTLGDREDFTYEDVIAMPYLDKVVSETLRKYPIVPILNRVCIEDYKIPNSDFCIKKGMNIIISIIGIQKDPNIYPDPEEFRPERFNSDEVAKRQAFTYFPFGEGPRICIGKRFGLLQVKVSLIKILSKYRVTVSEKTKTHLEPTIKNFLLTPGSKVFLSVERA